MRKLTLKQRKWSEIHEYNLLKRRDRKKKNLSNKTSPLRLSHKTNYIKFPPEITLSDSNFRKACLKLYKHKSIKTQLSLDFDEVIGFFPGGTIYLYAILDNLINIKNIRVKMCRQPKKKTEKEVLSHLGFLKILNMEHLEISATEDSVKYWKIERSGDITKISIANIFKTLEDQMQSTGSSFSQMQSLYRSAIEGACNIEHAYPKGDKNSHFWALYTFTKDAINFSVCDLGVGFSNTVKVQIATDSILRKTMAIFGKTPTDDQYIKGAVHASIAKAKELEVNKGKVINPSQTDLPNRGYGLKNVAEYANLPECSVRIYSGKGIYTKEQSNKEENKSLKFGIIGSTLIWDSETTTHTENPTRNPTGALQ